MVGVRVVVRHLVPGETGPSGGPAMTDVLGVCESWQDGIAVVRREDGTVVRIPTADIVAGKPVPPRPSVRMRVTPREAEAHALALWPHVRLEPLGDWVLRTDPAPVGRLLKRANSCLAMGDPGVPGPEAIATIRAFYAARDRDALAQVEQGSGPDTLFADAGWGVAAGSESHFQVAPVSRVLRAARPTVEALVEGDDMLVATIKIDGTEVASGRAGIDGDWIGVHGLTVVPTRRRQGLGRALVAALVERGAELGTTTAWLHVETDNEPALAMYDGLGFVTHHSNRYRRAPQDMTQHLAQSQATESATG